MGYEKYYNKTIKFSDLKYVTQEHIDGAFVNITSSEMYDEVKNLNDHFRNMQKLRRKYLVDFWEAFVANFIFFVAGTGMFIFENSLIMPDNLKKFSLLYSLSGGNITLCMIIATILYFAIVYFIFIRKIFSRTIVIFLSVLFVPINFFFLFTLILNPIMTNILKKIDDSIKDDVGYPHFVLLGTSYIREDEPLEDGVMEDAKKEISFDDYKIKPEDDTGFLK